MMDSMRMVFIGLSITSSWGNGHATNFRGLLRALAAKGHDVMFLERDTPWYANHRDLPVPPYGCTELYRSVEELRARFGTDVAQADVVVVGSYVPDGVEIGRWVTDTARGATAFYDIDTPVTLAALEHGDCQYLVPELIPLYDLYLSFTGGPTLRHLEQHYQAPRARAFHCLVDPDQYQPRDVPLRWDLGYLGTYSDDRQATLQRLLIEPAVRQPDRAFAVAGPQYPPTIEWPTNVTRVEHLAPAQHPDFYCSQRLTLNITRTAMVASGWSPSVRLFEAAACATPVMSDWWAGLDTFFRPGIEILVADSGDDVVGHLSRVDDQRRADIGASARRRVLAAHTAEHRAAELEAHVASVVHRTTSIRATQEGTR